jgi:PAS domain S-box-containing protein
MLLAVLLLVLLGGLGGFLLLARAQAVRSAEVTAENLVQVIEAQVAGDLGRLESLLRYAAAEFAPERISRLPAAEQAAFSRRLAQLLHDFPAAGGLNLFDSQGWLLLSDQAERAPFSIADRPHFQALRSNPGLSTVYSDALTARSNGAWSLVLSRAVRSPDGRLLGVVTAPLNLEAHARLFAGLHVGPHGVTLMRRSDTFQLIQRVPRMSEADFNQPLPASNAIRQRVAAGERRFNLHYAASIDGLPRVGSVRVLEYFPFYVQVALAEQDFLAAWRRQAAYASALTLLLLAAFGFAALRLHRSELAAAAALAAQAEADQRVRLALSGGDLGLWDWHIPSGQVVFNERWCAMLGYDLSEVEPHVDSWGGLVHPDDWPVIKAALDPHLQGETALYECEHRMRHKDGGWVWILDRGKVVRRDAAGGALRAVGTHMDISGRKAAEQELAESEERLRALFDIFPDGILLIDPQTTLPTAFNPLAHQQLGYTAEEFARLPIRAYEAEETPEEIAARSAAILEQGRADFETTHRRKDGSLLPVQVTVMRVSLRGATHFLSVMRDISGRKAAEQELRRISKLMRMILDSASEGICGLDQEGRTIFINRAGAAMLGWQPEELLGRCQHQIAHHRKADGTPYPEEDCPASRCCRDGQPREVTDELFWRKDGSSFPAEYVASPIIDSDGGITGAMLVFRSLSERVALLNDLARSNAELEQFAYAASHDLRQPLRMIANFLQLLRMELEETLTDAQKEYIQFAVSGAKRLDTMLLGLLEYSRVGRTGEPPVWLESRAVLDEALLFLRPAAAEAGAAVGVAGDWPRLKASPDGLLRLLQNLIGNALKFRRAGQVPEVTVCGELLADRWRLTVTDNGIGLPSNQRDRLFQVFSRLRTKGEYEGTGIGLAVARKIAEQHGGRIRAESPGEGQGSAFIVELPLAEAACA